MARALLSLLVGAMCAACHSSTDHVKEKVILAGDAAFDANNGFGGTGIIDQGSTTQYVSPTAVFAPSADGAEAGAAVGGRVVVAMNPGGGLTSWATSGDGITYSAPCAVNTAGCNAGTGVDARLNAAIGNGAIVRSRVALASEGGALGFSNGRVVMFLLRSIDMDPTTAEQLVAITSVDGGQTFTVADGVDAGAGSSSLVNGAGDCTGGEQDMPDAVFDQTTSPPTLVVVWRHKGGSTFGGCYRRGRLTMSGTISWDFPARTIDEMKRNDSLRGQGGLQVQAGNGAVTVVYQDDDLISACSTTGQTMGWGSVTTFNDGVDWVGDRFASTANFPPCFLQGLPSNRRVVNTFKAFSFIRTPSGQYYVAVGSDFRGIRLFHSTTYGLNWRELCRSPRAWATPGTCSNPAFGDYVSGNCLFADGGSGCSGTRELFFPTLAADANNRVALLFYRSPPNTTAPMSAEATVRASVNPLSPVGSTSQLELGGWQTNVVLDTSFGPPTFAGETRVLGERMAIAVRNGADLPRANCGGDGLFYALWAGSNGGVNEPKIKSTPVAVTP